MKVYLYTDDKEKLTLTINYMEYLNSTENYITSFIFFKQRNAASKAKRQERNKAIHFECQARKVREKWFKWQKLSLP